ncbi:glycoside hydrolase family 10 protein [Paenibacillus senegalensis]|uniref:hypothetical protein n=1 Tax=Paenibacillus senegalensis TaxID=1465766 RepID=UPI000288DAC9|nr:hypothetical protein [Paenibacillus senegalensis]
MLEEMENAVWLYMGKREWNPEQLSNLAAWCERNRISKVLLHLPLHARLRIENAEEIRALIDSCGAQGLEIHAMITTLVQRVESRSDLLLQDRDCYCIDQHGVANWDEPPLGKLFLPDPSHPLTVPTISAACRDIVEQFPGLAGIHLDFIRFYYYQSELKVDIRNGGHWNSLLKPGEPIRLQTADGSTATFFIGEVNRAFQDPPIGRELVLQRTYTYCYCSRCLSLFQQSSGVDIPVSLQDTPAIAKWLQDHAKEPWLQFRASLISDTVRAIREAMREHDPAKQLSAAVWYNAPYGNELREEPLVAGSVYEHFAQAWWEWAQEGLLDFVCPMNYWLKPSSFGKITQSQVVQSAAKVPVYAGLLRSAEFPIERSDLELYKQEAKSAGARGLSFFSYDGWRELI